MKFDRSNKFDFCYYGQKNSLRLKLSVASKWASRQLWGVIFILLLMVHISLIQSCSYLSKILHKMYCINIYQSSQILLFELNINYLEKKSKRKI